MTQQQEAIARTFIFTPITDRATAEQFQFNMARAGLMFHWDDSPNTIIDAVGNELFTDKECTALKARVGELFAAMSDPFALAVALTNAYDEDTQEHGIIWRVDRLTGPAGEDGIYDYFANYDEGPDEVWGPGVPAIIMNVGETIDYTQADGGRVRITRVQ